MDVPLEWLGRLWASIKARPWRPGPYDRPGPHDHYQGGGDDFDGGGP